MVIVNTHEAKTHLSRLLARVEAGEEVIIARAGKPVAKLVAAEPQRRVPVFGTAKGMVTFSDDWDAPMSEEELEEWYGPIEPQNDEE